MSYEGPFQCKTFYYSLKFTLNVYMNLKCLYLSQGTVAKSCVGSKNTLHLSPVRLLPLINLNLGTVLLRNKRVLRIHCLCVDHSSVCGPSLCCGPSSGKPKQVKSVPSICNSTWRYSESRYFPWLIGELKQCLCATGSNHICNHIVDFITL